MGVCACRVWAWGNAREERSAPPAHAVSIASLISSTTIAVAKRMSIILNITARELTRQESGTEGSSAPS